MGRISWTEKAAGHLQSIFEYISKDSNVYAARFVKSLIEAARKLEKAPNMGRIVPELEEHGFREVIYQNYRIVYRQLQTGSQVEILAVVHSARDFKKTFMEDWEL
jgi:addiction module RelE/StbE family toxin